MNAVQQKVVLITGASAGIGEGIALHFAKLGFTLSLTGRDTTRLDNVAKQCEAAGLPQEKILTVTGNLRDADHRKKIIDKTIKRFSQLDILVNNAGLGYPVFGLETTPEQYEETMDINLKTPFFLSQLAAPHLIQTKGNIVNISSSASTMPVAGMTAYCISKAGMDMYTQCLALELAPKGVRVNSVNPGTVVSMFRRRGNSVWKEDVKYAEFLESRRKQTPLGIIGQPSDVAEAVAYLVSDAARFVSGHRLVIDGAASLGGTMVSK